MPELDGMSSLIAFCWFGCMQRLARVLCNPLDSRVAPLPFDGLWQDPGKLVGRPEPESGHFGQFLPLRPDLGDRRIRTFEAQNCVLAGAGVRTFGSRNVLGQSESPDRGRPAVDVESGW